MATIEILAPFVLACGTRLQTLWQKPTDHTCRRSILTLIKLHSKDCRSSCISYLLLFFSSAHLLFNSFQTGFCLQHVTDFACQVLPGYLSAKSHPCFSALTSLNSFNIDVKHSFHPETLSSTVFENSLASLSPLSQCPLPSPHFQRKLSMRKCLKAHLLILCTLCLRVSCAHLSLKTASITMLPSS